MAHDSSEPTSVLKKGLALSPAQKLNAKEGTNPGPDICTTDINIGKNDDSGYALL